MYPPKSRKTTELNGQTTKATRGLAFVEHMVICYVNMSFGDISRF